jgi:hypothetical protein
MISLLLNFGMVLGTCEMWARYGRHQNYFDKCILRSVARLYFLCGGASVVALEEGKC